MKKLKGQVIVEFALILPLFLLIMYGIIYSGLLFYDYSTLNNIARASAREAALSGLSDYTGIEDSYEVLLNNLKTSFYIKDGAKAIKIKDTDDNKSVQTTIKMKLNVSSSFVEMVMPKTFGVQYYMRKEP